MCCCLILNVLSHALAQIGMSQHPLVQFALFCPQQFYFAKRQEYQNGKSPSKLATILRANKQNRTKRKQKTKLRTLHRLTTQTHKREQLRTANQTTN